MARHLELSLGHPIDEILILLQKYGSHILIQEQMPSEATTSNLLTSMW